MNENEIRSRLRDAMGESEYPPALSANVAARLNQPPSPGRPRLLAVVAGVLAAIIVLSLVYVRVNSTTLRPAAHPSPTPSVPLPAALIEQTHLQAAAGLITPEHLSTTIGTRQVGLIAAYADYRHTVLFFEVLPATAGIELGLWDETGFVVPATQLGTGPDGYQVFDHYSGPYAGPGSIAHLTASVTDPFDPSIYRARATGTSRSICGCSQASTCRCDLL